MDDVIVAKHKLEDKLVNKIKEFHINYPNLYVYDIDIDYLISATSKKELLGLNLDVRLQSSSK